MVSKGNHPQMALSQVSEIFRLGKYYNLPRFISQVCCITGSLHHAMLYHVTSRQVDDPSRELSPDHHLIF